MRRFAVKEIFRTIQGEGYHAGKRSVFVRFTGCNVWSGREEDRERDSAKGVCALWCDTDFVGTDGERGGSYTVDELLYQMHEARGDSLDTIAVFTGGEPGLQLTADLVETCQDCGFTVHVETNGSRDLPSNVDWTTLSPKPPMAVRGIALGYDEVKVVFDGTTSTPDPAEYEKYANGGSSGRLYVQPLDYGNGLMNASASACIGYVLRHPNWRMSFQMHKMLGMP